MKKNSKFTDDVGFNDSEKDDSEFGQADRNDEEKLRRIIEESVDESVNRAFRKYRIGSLLTEK